MAIKIRKEEKQKALEAKEGPKQEVNMDSLKKYIDKKVNQAKEPEPTPTPEPTSQILNENTAA
jgi:hypothetical protein